MIGVYDVNHVFYDIGDVYNKGCRMLNTLRHVIGNDTVWFGVLRGIQQKFRYKTITSADIEQYICDRSEIDLHYFFDHYLRQLQPPMLAIERTQQKNDVLFTYKWERVAPGFHMPVQISVGKNVYRLIFPTTDVKTLVLKNVQEEDAEVNQRDFYVDVMDE